VSTATVELVSALVTVPVTVRSDDWTVGALTVEESTVVSLGVTSTTVGVGGVESVIGDESPPSLVTVDVEPLEESERRRSGPDVTAGLAQLSVDVAAL
jgi:hypothetical protein